MLLLPAPRGSTGRIRGCAYRLGSYFLFRFDHGVRVPRLGRAEARFRLNPELLEAGGACRARALRVIGIPPSRVPEALRHPHLPDRPGAAAALLADLERSAAYDFQSCPIAPRVHLPLGPAAVNALVTAISRGAAAIVAVLLDVELADRGVFIDHTAYGLRRLILGVSETADELALPPNQRIDCISHFV